MTKKKSMNRTVLSRIFPFLLICQATIYFPITSMPWPCHYD